jgi:lipopolysaccharide export system protein LptA
MRLVQPRFRCPTAPCAPRQRTTPALLGMVLLGLAMGWASRVLALEGDQEQPILVEADSVELDDIKHLSVYIGNVQIDQGSMRILADHVTVQHGEGRRPQFITALGNPVRYRQDVEGEKGEVKAHAQRMEYDADKDELVLIDQAELTQAADRFSSERIVYDRAHAQVKAGASAQGTGRVKITITPEKKPETPAAAKPSPAPKAGQQAPAKNAPAKKAAARPPAAAGGKASGR